MSKDSLNALLNKGWEFRGEVQCSAHGGDHMSELYAPPGSDECKEWCPVEKAFNN